MALENVWVLRHDKVLELIVYDCHKISIFHYKSIFDQEMDHLSSAKTALNTLQNGKLFEFHWVHTAPIYRVSPPFQLSWGDPILLKCWYPLPETSLWYFDVDFDQKLFSNVRCQLQIEVPTLLIIKIRIPTTKLQKPEPYCPITSGSFTLCFVDIGSCLRDIMRCPWCNGYRLRKWIWRHEFKS